MTTQAPAEPYTWNFTATVDSVEGTNVHLDTTYFYAESGGQPADRGRLAGIDVTDVQYDGNGVVHELAREPEFEVGDSVEGEIDRGFRRYCMRAHTASHVLYGAGRRLLDDLGYGGFDISAPGKSDDDPSAGGKVRVDFTTSTTIDDDKLVEFERLVNRIVWDSRDVSWETLPREEALAREDIAFNTKTEEGIEGDTVRVVTVENWDVAACGGTHVDNTREIGPVTVLDRSNPGEGLTRVEFAVGERAIDRRAVERSRAMDAAHTLETGIEELPEAVESVHSERERLRNELDAARETLVEARIAELSEEIVEKNGQSWLVGTVDGLDANELADRAQDVVGSHADVVGLVGEGGQYVAVATTGDVDAGAVVDEVTDEFGGGGGGGPTVAQGGGLGASEEEIVSFLRA